MSFLDQPPFYMMMDYAEGEDFGKWAAQQGGLDKVPLESRLEIIAQVADALQAAHEAGIIHRDVKPSNIIVRGSSPETLRVKLTDFGMGRLFPRTFCPESRRWDSLRPCPGVQTRERPCTWRRNYWRASPLRPGRTYIRWAWFCINCWRVICRVHRRWTGAGIESPLLKEDLSKRLAGNPQERFAAAQELAQRLRTLPERRLELTRRDAEIAEKVKAAHRKGVMRATAVAMGVVLLMAGLAICAFHQSSVARREAARAEMKEKQVQTAELEAKTTLSASEFMQGCPPYIRKDWTAMPWLIWRGVRWITRPTMQLQLEWRPYCHFSAGWLPPCF